MTVFFSSYLCYCRDEAVQLACLKLVHALLRQLKTEDIVTLLPTLATFADSRSVTCRAAMYDIFMWLYDNYNNTAGSVALHITMLLGGLLWVCGSSHYYAARRAAMGLWLFILLCC